jgi:pimeloyl-ACP methyl ester carboxylesterase
VALVTRLTLVHGSVTNADLSWGRQHALAARVEIFAPNRPGFPPGPPVERVDFDRDAEWLHEVVRPGDHLVGHSYGGIGALIAAPTLDLGSLTVIEPPAFAVARGDPAVEAWVKGAFALPRDTVRGYTEAFLVHVGAPFSLPEPLTPELRQGAEAFFTERFPAEASIPLERLPFPVLVVTGDHEPAFEVVGDVLTQAYGAERAVLPGAGHAVQNARGFNERLRRFTSDGGQSS